MFLTNAYKSSSDRRSGSSCWVSSNSFFFMFHGFFIKFQMVLPTTLKRKHSLKGINILPLIKKVRAEAGQRVPEYARMQVSKQTEEMPLEELKGHFGGLTGEDSREILKLCDLEYLAENMRCLVHHSIMFANGFGPPKGQELRLVGFVVFSLQVCMLNFSRFIEFIPLFLKFCNFASAYTMRC